MKRSHLVRLPVVAAVWAALSAAPSVFGQTTGDTSSYFPLALGNSWTYVTFVDPPDAPWDTLGAGTFGVSSYLAINDTLYYRADFPFALADTVRSSADGNIWAWVDGEDVLLFDFSLEDGDAYTFEHGVHEFEVTAERQDSIELILDTYQDVVTLSFDDPLSVDEETSYTFAKGIGIIAAYGQMGTYVELYDATVYPMADTLDWHGYFPLEIGTRWQYQFEAQSHIGTRSYWVEDWYAAGDSVLEGTQYVRFEVKCGANESLPMDPSDCNPETTDHRLMRYDETAANVIELRGSGEDAEEHYLFSDHDFPLDAPFHSVTHGGRAYAYEFYPVEEPLMIKNQAVSAQQKRVEVLSAVPGSVRFAHGIGLVSMAFAEGGSQSQLLVYADVGGQTYGSYRPVATESPVDLATDVSLTIYPNPAAASLNMDYSLPSAGSVAFELYDLLGRRVLKAQQSRKRAGTHSATLDVGDVAAGMYMVALVVDETTVASTPMAIAR